MKSKYNATSNCLDELPRIPKPNQIDFRLLEDYKEEWREYIAHLVSLRRIPCHLSCVGKWSDGQEVEENKDYEVKLHYHAPDDKELIAFPLPVMSEGSWKDLFHKIWGDNKDGIYNKKDWQLLLQKLEIITKK